METTDPFSVSIVFEQSHLFFPRIIHWLLLIMLLTIGVFQGVPFLRDVRAGKRTLLLKAGHFDRLRFFGTILLTIVYFLSMQYVGDLYPNSGFGFLFMSIPYMFLLSWLYLHHRDRRHLLLTGINAVVAPTAAWYVLAQVFRITLP